jgi:hypothetical protein
VGDGWADVQSLLRDLNRHGMVAAELSVENAIS